MKASEARAWGVERLAAQWVVWSATVQATYWKCPLQVHHFIIKETNSTPRSPHSPPSASKGMDMISQPSSFEVVPIQIRSPGTY